MASSIAALTPRWYPLKAHPVQAQLYHNPARFCIVPAGRRSGKTEIAKRFGIRSAFRAIEPNSWYVFGAPTHTQAKRIYWKDLKQFVPLGLMSKRPSESELTIYLANGAEVTVMGMDAPERLEGRPLDGIVLDEYANMRAQIWTENVRPALSTPHRTPGWAWLIGVPEGRNHYYELYKRALKSQAIAKQLKKQSAWGVYHWASSDIVSPDEIASAKEDMDEQTYRQEYGGEFVSYDGLAYYPFDPAVHAAHRLEYDIQKDLIFCFDFNTSPGIAVVAQEQTYRGSNPRVSHQITGVIGEVHIPRHSNTNKVCDKLLALYGKHAGTITCYGDATGGSSGSAKVDGSDWDLIHKKLKPTFGYRLRFRVDDANPRERARVNAMNSRLKTVDGEVRMLFDPVSAPHTIRCVQDTPTLEGGTGEIDKDADKTLSHMSDALGYYIEKRYPVRGGTIVTSTSV